MDEAQQELMFKLSMFEQQIQQLRQQLQTIEQGIIELSTLSIGLDELVGSKDKEIMAPIGRGIFVKAKLLSEELTVDVGGNNLVKKSIPDTQKIIKEQIGKLENAKKELDINLNNISHELNRTIMDAQEKEKNRTK